MKCHTLHPSAKWTPFSFRTPRIQAKQRSGAAMVELAVTLPLLVFFFALCVDYGRVFYFRQILGECARHGAMYLSDEEGAKSSPYASAEEAIKATAPDFIASDLKVSTGSGTNSSGLDYVEVTVVYHFTTLLDVPWIPTSQTLSRTVKMRVTPAVPDDR